MIKDNIIELLAPAGSVTGLKAVIEAGADAVYIGGTRFGARAYAENPDESDLISAIDYAHMRGVRVYLTVNTLLKEQELGELTDYIRPYYEHGIDAILVQDFGVLKLLHETFPDLPLHASTQMTVTGPCSARMLGEYGVKRVVPARELSLTELNAIKEESGLEVEAFVHGAICVCYSGQCLLSSMIGGRSGNRGRCAQPCRLPYSLKSDNSAGESGKSAPFKGELLSPKDMCNLDQLPDLIEAGVCSFKIEGRMKQPEYAAGVVSIYRKYLDIYKKSGRSSYKVSRKDRQTLLTLFNRDGFTDGYLTKHNGADMMALKRRTLTEQEERTRSALYSELKTEYVDCDTSLLLYGEATVFAGKPLTLNITEKRTGENITVTGEKVQRAENRPLAEKRIYDQLMKTGGSGYRFLNLTVSTDGKSFVPMAQLNALRREAFASMTEKLLSGYIRSCDTAFYTQEPPEKSVIVQSDELSTVRKELSPDSSGTDRCRISAEVTTVEQFRSVLLSDHIDTVYIPYDFLGRKQTAENEALTRARLYLEQASLHGKKLFLATPYIERNDGSADLKNLCPKLAELGFDGFLVRSFETLAELREAGLEALIRTDSSIYTFNGEARRFLSAFGFQRDTVPVELNKKEIMNRRNDDSELIVYGHLPLMITAQCLQKTTIGCTGNRPSLLLSDRKSRKFPVSCDCTFCYNIIRNPVVLSLFGETDFLQRAGIRRMRLVFTRESGEETLEICKISKRTILESAREDIPGEHTKGHFNRGVE